MNFSLILPSRERPVLLRQFLESVRDTVARPDLVEVFIAVDHDDVQTISIAAPFKMTMPFHFQIFYMPRQDNLSEGYYNWLAAKTTGDYLWILNDDCVLTAKGWDTAATFAIAEHYFRTASEFGPDQTVQSAFYGRTHDNLGDKFSMFPILSRDAYEAQGWVLNPAYPAWGADENLYRIWGKEYRGTDGQIHPGLDRVVDLPMCTVEHRSFHHDGKLRQDEVSKRVGSLSRHSGDSVEEQVERIRAKLGGSSCHRQGQ